MKSTTAWVFLVALVITTCQAQPKPSLEEQIGQMLLVGFRGFELTAQSPIVRDIQSYHVGGVILFDYDVPMKKSERNINSPEQVKRLNAQLQSFNKSNLPLFIAIDQEGGRVHRLKPRYGFPYSVSAAYLGTMNREDSTRFHARKTSKLLKDLGINLNFAPVLDVNVNANNPIIGKLERSFSSNPTLVVTHARWWMEEAQKVRVASALKHFPGHGSSDKDSHLGMVDVTQSWMATELIPFKEIIASKPEMVMSAHIYQRELDANWPATLSPKILTELLREDLKFDGVIVSDDMQMEAIRAHFGLETALVQGIKAGIDVFIFANNSVFEEDIARRAIEIIKKNVANGTIPKERIEESYNRIKRLKESLK